MKRLFPFFVLVLALACQENQTLEKKNSVQDVFLQSTAFKELKFDAVRLNVEKFGSMTDRVGSQT
jgi:hypothetical protein